MEKTRILILSDTHGDDFLIPDLPVDVAIHCGDLTEESKIGEFRDSLELLRRIKAPLKLVIAGNHDFTLDSTTFQNKIDYARSSFSIEPDLLKREYGDMEEARRLFPPLKPTGSSSSKKASTISAFKTAQRRPFQARRKPRLRNQHRELRRHRHHARSPAAIARVRPRLHCFGHIHKGWGAKLVAWRGEEAGEDPSHFSEIDNGASVLVESLATLKPGKWDAPRAAHDKMKEHQRLVRQGFRGTSHCSDDEHPLIRGRHTLFVNAALEALDEKGPQLPWVVDIDLPSAT